MVIDQFSKLAKMAPTKTIVTTFDFAKFFFDMWVKHHAWDATIFRKHRDAKFTTGFWKHLFQNAVTKLSINTIFHPQTNGPKKGVQWGVRLILKNYVNANKKDWGEHLGLVESTSKFTNLKPHLSWFFNLPSL